MKHNPGNRKEIGTAGSPPCLHVVSGRVRVPKICTPGQDCRCCGFDQWLDHTEAAPAYRAGGRPDEGRRCA